MDAIDEKAAHVVAALTELVARAVATTVDGDRGPSEAGRLVATAGLDLFSPAPRPSGAGTALTAAFGDDLVVAQWRSPSSDAIALDPDGLVRRLVRRMASLRDLPVTMGPTDPERPDGAIDDLVLLVGRPPDPAVLEALSALAGPDAESVLVVQSGPGWDARASFTTKATGGGAPTPMVGEATRLVASMPHSTRVVARRTPGIVSLLFEPASHRSPAVLDPLERMRALAAFEAV